MPTPGVVFDEVVGAVDPERTDEVAPRTEPAPKQPDDEVLRSSFRRLMRRHARLRAD